MWSIYCIDFSINAGALTSTHSSAPGMNTDIFTILHHSVMAVDRALVIDTLPKSEQEAGNAWASRMSGIGGIAGFFVYVHITQIRGIIEIFHEFPHLSHYQWEPSSPRTIPLLWPYPTSGPLRPQWYHSLGRTCRHSLLRGRETSRHRVSIGLSYLLMNMF